MEINSGPIHYAAGIWKRRFHSENASKVFRPHYAKGIWNRNNQRSLVDLSLRKTRSGRSHDHRISDCYSNFVFKRLRLKMFSVRSKTQSQRFQIPLVWRAFSKSSSLFSLRTSVDGRPNRRNKAAFSDSSSVVLMTKWKRNSTQRQSKQLYFITSL